MRKRERFRAWFTTDTPCPAPTPTVPLTPAQQTHSPRAPSISPPPCLPPSSTGLHSSSTGLPDATIPRTLVLEKAIADTLKELPQIHKSAFAQASKTIDEQTLLSRVQIYDKTHKEHSSFRLQAERLSKFLHLLNTFMGGVAIGIQASPEISSLVVGSIRVVIDLAIKFTTYFSKLTDMICTFQDYLGPLAEYAKAADINLVEDTVVNAYKRLLCFGWKARHVFIDANDNQRKWTSFRTFMRQHWEPFEFEFGTIKEIFQHDLDVLLHSVQSLHFDLARKDEQARRRREEAKERLEFLNWVSSIDFEKTHQDTFAKKHNKTGDWLINHPDYQQWFSGQGSSLLWCHGKPGIGKTVLASNIIEDITAKVGLGVDAFVCFAYYNYQNAQLRALHQIVAALIKQLCRRKPNWPSDLLQTKRDALPSSLVGTQDRFISLIEDLSQVYVVFDALDECPEQERGDILGFMTGIVTAQIGCRVKVFVTSRREMDIAKAFSDKNVPTIQIQTKNVTADIESFARSQVERLQAGEHGKTLYITNDELKEKIIGTLATKADGMFLWVKLQLDSLCLASKAQKDRVVEAALSALPQGLPGTYVRIMERIEAQSPYMRELALNCLVWTIYARRPLSTVELQEALAVNSNCESIQHLQPDSPQVILEACCNLLQETNGSIRPIHYTVQEFLTRTVQGLPQKTMQTLLQERKSMHRIIGLGCLVYARLVAFEKPVEEGVSLRRRLHAYPLVAYACQNFDYHVFQCGEPGQDIFDELESLFRQDSAYLAAILQIKVWLNGYTHRAMLGRFNRMDFVVTPSTIIYSTFLYCIPTMKQKCLGQPPPTYALQLAASTGLASGVIGLLQAGCPANGKDNIGKTALYYACLNGYAEIVEALFDNGADVNAEDDDYGSALQLASRQGHGHIVELLLEKGVNVNIQGGGCIDALQQASGTGYAQIVEMLIKKGADVNAPGEHYGTALQLASRGGYDHIVRMLINEGADVNAPGLRFGNALHLASYAGHEQIVKMLLEKGADVNAQDGGRNALEVASREGHERIVKILLDNGANVNTQAENFNALQAASSRRHEQRIVQMRLDAGAYQSQEDRVSA